VLEQRCPARVCKDLIAYYILPEKCEKGCDHCVLACPAEAIFSDEKGLKVVARKNVRSAAVVSWSAPQSIML